MVCQTKFDFFGGYDHQAGGGFVHVADRHVAPGKKQWTWGDHEFGRAWDRELTDANGPYVELMAGVYTDNQPDFSYLAPFETKTFSQFWWPIQGIGPVQQANQRVALRMNVGKDRIIDLGLCVSETLRRGTIRIFCGREILLSEEVSLAPGDFWTNSELRLAGENPAELKAVVSDHDGNTLLIYQPLNDATPVCERELATKPQPPEEIQSADELYLTGEHLELYRHPTREPEAYWQEALRRDSGDARCNIAMGRRFLRNGSLDSACESFRAAVKRLTRRHPNPETGEAHYYLGLALFFQDRMDEARESFSKAAWNHAWRGAALYHLACIECRTSDFASAMRHLDELISCDGCHHKAKVLRAAILRLRQNDSAAAAIDQIIGADPLDHWARHESMLGGALSQREFLSACRNDAQTILDLVFDYADAGLHAEATGLLLLHLENEVEPAAVPNALSRSAMCRYVLAWLGRDAGLLEKARGQSPDYLFPSRVHEQIVLEWARRQPGADVLAAYGLGNYYYDRKRHVEAIGSWERAVADGAAFATVFRNLGIGVWNSRRDRDSARSHYLRAIELDPADARLVSEYDQLCSKLNDPPEARLEFLEKHTDLVLHRDDCTVALVSLYNLRGRAGRALEILTSRRFHPWEGGEGSVLRQYATARISLGREALEAGDAESALNHFATAMSPPANLGEAYHLLQAKADVNYWVGRALKALGRKEEADRHFLLSAEEDGDFSDMEVTAHSPLSYYRGLSLRELDRESEALAMFEDLGRFATLKLCETAHIDYFATSLPNLLVFEEDLQARRDAENHLLHALAMHGAGNFAAARQSLEKVLAFNKADQAAVELMTELCNHPAHAF
jgi:tetratricopeptide (TPR) repeat protein